jgi:hypothetical protein
VERKVEGKTVDVYVRLDTSAWSRRGEDARTLSFARQPAAIVRLGWVGVNWAATGPGESRAGGGVPRGVE